MATYKNSNGVKRELRVFKNGNNEITVGTGFDNDSSVCISIPHQELANLFHEAGIVLPEPEVKPRFRVGDIIRRDYKFFQILWVSDDGKYLLPSSEASRMSDTRFARPSHYTWKVGNTALYEIVGHYNADTDTYITYTPNE